ncbi:MAG: flagellar biosynthetic protein FliO [Planctomycetota bacterium]
MRRAFGGLWLLMFLVFGGPALAAPETVSPSIPTRPGVPLPSPETAEPLVSPYNIVTVVGFLIFAIALAIWLKGRRSKGDGILGKKGKLRFLESMLVGVHKVHVVALGDRVYVLGSSNQGLTCLDVIRDGSLHAELTQSEPAQAAPSREFRDEYASMVEEMSRSQKGPVGGWQGKLAGELEDIRRRLKDLP